MQNKILIRNLQSTVSIKVPALRILARWILKRENVSGAELSVLIVSDEHICRLNRQYRGKNRATDVLAFRMADAGEAGACSGILGDVVVSAETAARQADELGVRLSDELALYLVHGILHLLGYTDQTPENFRMMKQRQEELLRIYEQSTTAG